jgi:hypothetical protein
VAKAGVVRREQTVKLKNKVRDLSVKSTTNQIAARFDADALAIWQADLRESELPRESYDVSDSGTLFQYPHA